MNNNIIKECLKEALNEYKIREKVRRIVKEETEKEMNNDNEKGKRGFVTAALKDDDTDKYDHAHLAYKLWPDLDPDTARSYFSKCVRGERNFSNKDITTLYELIRAK